MRRRTYRGQQNLQEGHRGVKKNSKLYCKKKQGENFQRNEQEIKHHLRVHSPHKGEREKRKVTSSVTRGKLAQGGARLQIGENNPARRKNKQQTQRSLRLE